MWTHRLAALPALLWIFVGVLGIFVGVLEGVGSVAGLAAPGGARRVLDKIDTGASGGGADLGFGGGAHLALPFGLRRPSKRR